MKTKTATKFRFLVAGPVPGFQTEIQEWTTASNEAQATKQVAIRLQQKFRVPIYLGNCKVIRGSKI